jgi:hypothetical protein
MRKPIAYVTRESLWRLQRGGNCKGAVPMHLKPSVVANIGLYHEGDVAKQDALVKELAAALRNAEEYISDKDPACGLLEALRAALSKVPHA